MMAKALKSFLEKNNDFTIELLDDLKKLEDIKFLKNFDILVIDINLNGYNTELNGLDIAEMILKINKDTKIVILSGYDYEYYIERAKRIGAYGFISKDEDIDLLCKKLTSIYLEDRKIFKEKKKSVEKLTKNEIEIVKLYCSGLKRSEVAADLFISQRSLAVMLNRIYQKLCVNNYQELMKKSIDLGIIDSF